METIEVESYFDGDRLHEDGPFVFEIAGGRYRSIRRGGAPAADRRGGLLLPTAVEAHAHLFLDGDELDRDRRGDYLKRSRAQWLATARSNVDRCRRAGITVIRDAGDAAGVNLELRREFAASGMRIIAAGHGIRRAGRYGSFFAREIGAAESPAAAVGALAAAGADAIKIVLTGIIDFEHGAVKGSPQFTREETRAIVDAAHELGLKTFAHCSGLDGLRIAAAAGVDSIEHGFFMERDILAEMAAKAIAWTPTLLPVYFQWAHPEYCAWSAAAVGQLRRILDRHAALLVEAEALGVPIMAGSDAGSFGAPHAEGLWTEVALLRQAGLRAETALRSATSTPRRHFGLPPCDVAPGAPADFVLRAAGPAALFRPPPN